MKRSYVILTLIMLTALFSNSNLFAQTNWEDVVYLKNGSIIHGVIIEQTNVAIKIQTADKNIFTYKMDEIEKLTKEQTNQTYKTNVTIQTEKTNDTVKNETKIQTQNNKTKTLVYLKNGFSIEGTLLEKNDKTFKVKGADGKIYEYDTKDFLKEEEVKIAVESGKFSKKCYFTNITEISFLYGRAKFNTYEYGGINNENDAGFIGLQTINGIHIGKNNFLGIGLGINGHLMGYFDAFNYFYTYLRGEAIPEKVLHQSKAVYYLSFPVFLNYRNYFTRNKTQPFLGLDLGFLVSASSLNNMQKLTMLDCHPYTNLSFGVKFSITKNISMNVCAGYSFFYFTNTVVEGSRSSNYSYYDENGAYQYCSNIYVVESQKYRKDIYNNLNSFTLKAGFVF
jgi:hypothetical protein